MQSPPDIRVDEDLCIGAGNCARLARGAFRLDERDVARVVDPGAVPLSALRRAERSCPAGAITLVAADE